MAKQSGLHQIRGKVGEHSYYRQTGVSSGLIRSINQGMSARVKTGEEYANTRRNNQEFAFACQYAGALGSIPTPKFRPMVLPFSQSKMAKEILRIVKTTSTGNWGWRGTAQAQMSDILKALNDTAKYPFSDYVSQISTSSVYDNPSGKEEWSVNLVFQSDFQSRLESIGASSIDIKVIAVDLLVGEPSMVNQKLGSVRVVELKAKITNESPSYPDEVNYDVTGIVPITPVGLTKTRVLCVVCMPKREVGSESYILQEYCTFQVMEVPAPEP